MDWKNTARVFIVITGLIGLSACSSLLARDPRSGYDEGDASAPRATDFYAERDQHKEEQVREELGWESGRSLNDSERVQLETRLRLNRLESKLESQREKRQYYQIKGLMRNDRERIGFLSLPNVEARERWAGARGLVANDEAHSEEVASIIEKNDVGVGMSQKAVTESWGDPDLVEVAGDPIYGNERWRYSRYVSANDGYQKQTRVIYFESGRVVGWETR